MAVLRKLGVWVVPVVLTVPGGVEGECTEPETGTCVGGSEEPEGPTVDG